jgi:hypothetical protein
MKATQFLTAILFASYVSAFGQIPTAGLVAYWPFNGNANDESGSGYNGTVNGVVFNYRPIWHSRKSIQFCTSQLHQCANCIWSVL